LTTTKINVSIYSDTDVGTRLARNIAHVLYDHGNTGNPAMMNTYILRTLHMQALMTGEHAIFAACHFFYFTERREKI